MKARSYCRTLWIATLLLSPLPVWAQDAKEEVFIIPQPDAAVAVIEFKAEYKEEGKDFFGRYSPDRIDLDIRFRNGSQRDITAVRFGVISFNVFDEFMSQRRATTTKGLEPRQAHSLRWQSFPLDAFAFLTGIVYVDAVRFLDGEIWRADYATVIEQAASIGIELEEADLIYTEGPRPFLGEQ